jgi:hypothetical protein
MGGCWRLMRNRETDVGFQTEGSKQDPLKMLKPDGGLNNEAIYARYFGDYQDMVLAFYRVFSVVQIWSSPVVDKGWSISAVRMGRCMRFTEAGSTSKNVGN